MKNHGKRFQKHIPIYWYINSHYRFSISLATGRCNGVEQFDIGFQMLVNLSDEQVVFKQQLNMVWLEVDRENFDTAVFRHPFRILIVLDETKYLIAVNGESQWRMRYGLPVQKLNSLKIEGHLMAIKQVHHRKYFPYTWPMLQLPEDHLHFSHDIPVSFESGHVMVILMKLQGKIDGRFNIDFRNLKHIEEIEVHFSIRFHSRTIVRNSMLPILDLNTDLECPARIE